MTTRMTKNDKKIRNYLNINVLPPPGCLRTPISKEFKPDFG